MSFLAADVVARLSSLSSAIIDTSSLIYLSKINCLSLLVGSCKLFTIPEVVDEYGENISDIAIIDVPGEKEDADQTLIRICVTDKLMLISEDKKVLLDAQENNIPYFNSLMMLNFLLLKKKISREDYATMLEKLKTVARYSMDVWRFGAEVNNVISNLSR
jgi:hypothetical protein